MKFIFFILLFGFVFAAEPSVFEMQSSVTKKEVEELKKINSEQSDRIFTLENKIKQLETSLEGLKSIYEGYGVNIKDINDKINQIPQESKTEDLNQLKEEITNNKNNIQALKENIDTHLKQIQEFITNEINQKDNKEDSNSTIALNDSKNITESSFDKDATKKSEIFKEARTLTYTKKFDEAIERYKWLIEIDYKRAESNYMLGNIAYEQNRYKDAVFYYKESATIDENAKYIPRLLLNTANSFRVLNDKNNANRFYNAVLDRFPNSIEAKEAKKHIKE